MTTNTEMEYGRWPHTLEGAANHAHDILSQARNRYDNSGLNDREAAHQALAVAEARWTELHLQLIGSIYQD
jgi:hypothetical protein